MNTRRFVFGVLAACLLAVSSVVGIRADAQGVGVAAKVGSTGIGADLTFRLTKPLNLRIGGSFFGLDREFTQSDITFDGKATLAVGTALLDLHPGGGNFRISAGAVYNKSKGEGDSVGGTVVLNGVPYDVNSVGKIHGEVTGNEIGPYAGIGWGNAVREGSRLRFVMDLGVYYWGSPKVALTATPTDPALVPPTFYADLEAERQQIEDDVSQYKFYPVVSFGLSYRF